MTAAGAASQCYQDELMLLKCELMLLKIPDQMVVVVFVVVVLVVVVVVVNVGVAYVCWM